MTKENEVKSNDEGLKHFNLIVLFVFTITALSIVLYYYKFGLGLWDTPEKWGALGDFFGGVLNPLLAFSSLVLLLATLRQNHKALSQNEEALRLNNTELEMTREELAESKKALIQQAEILKKQSFEGTFFNLLSIHQDLVNSIDLVAKNNKVTKGKDCFKPFYQRLRDNFNQLRYNKALDPEYFSIYFDKKYLREKELNEKWLLSEEYIRSSYMAFYGFEQDEIGHYFRNLYNIIKFVDQSDIENKKLYINILRAQLSTYELALLFYNCLSPLGSIKFKPFIEKYALLKGVNSKILLRESHKDLYKPTAFKGVALTT